MKPFEVKKIFSAKDEDQVEGQTRIVIDSNCMALSFTHYPDENTHFRLEEAS